MELHRVGARSDFASTEADGNQYAELNAYLSSRLYQEVATVPGTRLLWQFAHRARPAGDNTSGTLFDVLQLSIRPTGTPGVDPTLSEIIYTANSNALDWYYYNGTYTVPVGQTNTEFGYSAIFAASGNDSIGNFLDVVKFETGASLIAKKIINTSTSDNVTALEGEAVTISIDITNWGEADASRCVFRDILSDDLDYIDGSAAIDGVSAGSLATFNSVTDELRINFGAGAIPGTANTNGGVLEGSQNTGTSGTTGEGETISISFQAIVTGSPGDVVRNQSSTTYNDSTFEAYNATDFTAYSSVVGQSPTAGDETTYVNQFTILPAPSSDPIERVSNPQTGQKTTDRWIIYGVGALLLMLAGAVVIIKKRIV